MISNAIAFAKTPQGRMALNIARQVAKQGVKFVGRSRRRRANKGQWYFGRRVGIPPSRLGSEQTAKGIQVGPVSVGKVMSTNVAKSSLRVVGTEWLADVKPTHTIDGVWADVIPINPSEPGVFPRLCQIASQYQKYNPVSLRVNYVPTCATDHTGALYMAVLANPTTAPPETVQDIMGLQGTQRCSPWQTAQLPVPLSLMSPSYKSYFTDVPVGYSWTDQDVTKTVASIVLMTSGVNTGAEIGKLSVTYVFDFSDPKTDNTSAQMSGRIEFGAVVDGDPLDFHGADEHGTLPVRTVAGDTTLAIKRHRGHLLVFAVLKGTGVTAFDLGLQFNGVSLTATMAFEYGTTEELRVYKIPAGPGVITATPTYTATTQTELNLYLIAGNGPYTQ